MKALTGSTCASNRLEAVAIHLVNCAGREIVDCPTLPP